MYPWILVIISHVYGGTSTASIPDFYTQASCQKAADEWVKQAKRSNERGRAFCIHR